MVIALVSLAGTAACAVVGWAGMWMFTTNAKIRVHDTQLKSLPEIVQLKLDASTGLILEKLNTRDSQIDSLDQRLARMEKYLNGHYLRFVQKDSE